MSAKYEYLFKVLLIGDSNAGKTPLLLRFAEQNGIRTIGIDFKFRRLEVENKIVKLQIWDTAGNERFSTITPSSFRGAKGILLVYNVSDEDSFKKLNTYRQLLNECTGLLHVCVMLVGNQFEPTSKKVDFTTAKQFADELNIPFMETNVMDGTNVEEVLRTLATAMLHSVGQDTSHVSDNTTGTVKVHAPPLEPPAKESSCF